MASLSRNLAIYIHWPFCLKLCPYCSFNKLKSPVKANDRKTADDRLTAAIVKDLQHSIKSLDSLSTYTATSIHFGGGTPSLMPPDSVKSLINTVKESINVSSALQIALEGNPSSLTEPSLHAFKDACVNRLSIGIQSFRDSHLSFLGRDHSGANAWSTLKTAYTVFSDERDTVSCDLMFGLPNQTPKEWKDDLTSVLESIPSTQLKHMSLYQLTYEPGTPLWKSAKRSGFDVESTADSTAEMYETAVDLLHTKSGLKHYEVSNYAIPGHESVHNLAYWRGWDYIGVGPGAHGRISDLTNKTRRRTSKYPQLETYIRKCEELGHGTQVSKQLEKQTMIKELIVLGLRIKEGVSFTTAQELAFGDSVKQSLDWDAVKRHCEMGFLEYDERREILKPTERGLSVIDTILADVIKQ